MIAISTLLNGLIRWLANRLPPFVKWKVLLSLNRSNNLTYSKLPALLLLLSQIQEPVVTTASMASNIHGGE